MTGRPKWRLPLWPGAVTNLNPTFAGKRFNIKDAPRCQAIAKITGKTCRRAALKGSSKCQYHGGIKEAEATARARYGDRVIIVRNHQKQAWAKLGSTTPWPQGLPQRPDLLTISVVARGRLFEAWFNRHTDPENYKNELARPRIKWGKLKRGTAGS